MIGNRKVWCRIGVLTVIAAAIWIAAIRQIEAQSGAAPQYAPNGQLLAPVGYETWVFVGSNIGLAYKPDAPAITAREAARADKPQFHNVYINPEAYARFVATRQFPELTVLVMEKFAAVDRDTKGVLASGSFNGDRVGLEVAVKNSRRPDGSSTPWAYYDLTDPADPSKVRSSAPAFPDAVCESCHRQHASMDNVWVQFYPVLRNATK
jgi:Cytochrome P460